MKTILFTLILIGLISASYIRKE